MPREARQRHAEPRGDAGGSDPGASRPRGSAGQARAADVPASASPVSSDLRDAKRDPELASRAWLEAPLGRLREVDSGDDHLPGWPAMTAPQLPSNGMAWSVLLTVAAVMGLAGSAEVGVSRLGV